jgi:dTDP-4-amino-4,6-dideoxygalactose transaminase
MASKPEKFRFLRPTLPPLESVWADYSVPYAEGIITNARLTERLEAAVAERLGTTQCVAVSSCTSGLMLVLRAMDLQGEVILPSFTFFATGHALLWNRLKPVFADSTADSWTLDPADVERRITERTSAILAVHVYGNPCLVDRLAGLASRYKLKLIFDAAHAFGSCWAGRPVGQFGDAEVFSLSPTKLLVAGEGGLVTTNDSILARRIRAGRNYGDLGDYDPFLLGLNARMSEFHAALALAGLPLVDRKVKRHNAIAATYTAMLSGLAGVSVQGVRPQDTHAYKDYSIHLQDDICRISRSQLADALYAANIETKKYFFPALHDQKLFRDYAPGNLPQAERLAKGILSLPIYESLPDAAVERVALAIRTALA